MCFGKRVGCEGGDVFGKAQTMCHLHAAGSGSHTGTLLGATIALLLNGRYHTGSHIKAKMPGLRRKDGRRVEEE